MAWEMGISQSPLKPLSDSNLPDPVLHSGLVGIPSLTMVLMLCLCPLVAVPTGS